jgi:hypothetical protein
VDRLRAILSGLSTKEILAFVIALLLGLARKYEKEKAARMKGVQSALATAEAKTKSAEVKEQTAAQIDAVNQSKAKDTAAKAQQIEQNDKAKQDEINQKYEADKADIERDASYCERVHDACDRANRLGLKLELCQSSCE